MAIGMPLCFKRSNFASYLTEQSWTCLIIQELYEEVTDEDQPGCSQVLEENSVGVEVYQPWDNDPIEQQENYEVPDTHEGDTYEVPGDDEQETYEIVDGAEQGALIRF